MPIEDVMKPKKIPALPTSGKRESLRTFYYRFRDHILASCEWHLGCPPQVAGPESLQASPDANIILLEH